MRCKACDRPLGYHFKNSSGQYEDLCPKCRGIVQDTLYWMQYTKEIIDSASFTVAYSGALAQTTLDDCASSLVLDPLQQDDEFSPTNDPCYADELSFD